MRLNHGLAPAARTWETGPRLRSIVNVASNIVVTSHSYHYDSLDRRVQAALEDSSNWNYDYNDCNELTGARRYLLRPKFPS